MAQIITKAKKANRYNMNTTERTIHNYIAPEAGYYEALGNKAVCAGENENNDKSTWKKVLEFVVKLIELIIATFFGASAANMFNIFN